MSGPAETSRLRFASFEFDTRARELRHDGALVDVQDQPLRLLATLIERPGELVTREELHRRLWPADTFVDFEHGLNAAVRRLRVALGSSPDGQQFIETLPRRGYRFVVPVECTGGTGQPSARKLTRLMLMPFRAMRADPDIEFLALSVPDAVAAALAGLKDIVVRSPAAAARYAAPPLDLALIAREAQVDAVLIGTVARAGARVRVGSQLARVPDGTLIWSDTTEVSLDDLFQLQDTIVRRLVESLPLSLTVRDRAVLEADVPSNGAAYELYLRANRIALKGVQAGIELESARRLYEQALQVDPDYAPAWARLGRCHWLLAKSVEAADHLSRADACFTRALAINPELLLAHGLHAQLEADLGRAPDAMVRLIRLARRGTEVPEIYAALTQVCRYCGQLEASVAAHERARGLDPWIPTSVNHTYYQLGDLERAFASGGAGTFILDARLLAMRGRTAEAVALLRERESRLPSTTRAFAASVRALFEGDRERCVTATEQAIAHWPDPEGRYYLALNFAQLGLADRAIAEIDHAVRGGYVCYRALASEPALGAARAAPGFAAVRDRAAARYRDACVAFADAGGQILFGL